MGMITAQLTEEQFEQKRKQLADNGVVLAGSSGTVSAKGCTITFSYSGGLLTVNVDKAPFGMHGMAEREIRQWLGVQG